MAKPPKPVPPAPPARPPAPSKPAPPARPIRTRPILPHFQVGPDPLDPSTYPDDIEESAAEELSQLERGFRGRAAAEAKRFSNSTCVDYYCVVACENGEQLAVLMKALGVDPGERYVDGRMIADRLGITLPAADVRYNTSSRIDPKLSKLVRTT